jgi:hypothetical protein
MSKQKLGKQLNQNQKSGKQKAEITAAKADSADMLKSPEQKLKMGKQLSEKLKLGKQKVEIKRQG